MEKNITIRLDDTLLKNARAYAEARGTSVANLLSAYLATLPEEPPADDLEHEKQEALGPLTRSLGARPDREVSEADHRRHLERKHR